MASSREELAAAWIWADKLRIVMKVKDDEASFSARPCGSVHRKLSSEQALSMAKKLKAEALGLPTNHDIEIENGQA